MKSSATIIIPIALIALLAGCTPQQQVTPTTVAPAKTSVSQTAEPGTTDQSLVRTIMAVLITTKEKNYGKQYDVILCTACKGQVSKEDYVKAWTEEFGETVLTNVSLPTNNEIKVVDNKAEVTPRYQISVDKDYTPKSATIKTLHFIKEQDGMWRLDWSK